MLLESTQGYFTNMLPTLYSTTPTFPNGSSAALVRLMSRKRSGGYNRRTCPSLCVGTPISSRNLTIGFRCDSTGNRRRRGNDSIRYLNEVSQDPNISRPPRLASIF
uniref:Uncharacterized protein n=1 Tax=Opuntia streptacantha TaxID=393608 RepID=A0A7C9ALV0_OPUST